MEEEKKEKKKGTFGKVINAFLWVVLLAWIAICLTDFFRTHEEKEPMFCIKKETTKYPDGKVESCTGLGYKIYRYNRKSFNGIEYGPFWFKDRSSEESK